MIDFDVRRRGFGRLAEAARAAEEAGFDAISVPDHVHQNPVGGGAASRLTGR
jgi:alkanesulfonate monooxygenase SsuD/methylene tetrahydromethanopterin reductase-like flavin-dependent oxidoreductase (luciferase family)